MVAGACNALNPPTLAFALRCQGLPHMEAGIGLKKGPGLKVPAPATVYLGELHLPWAKCTPLSGRQSTRKGGWHCA